MPRVTRREALAAAAAGLAVGTLGLAAQRTPGPPLWVAERRSAKVFFFGQLPLRTDSVWLSGAIQEAFERSSELWTENPDPAGAAPPPPPAATGPKLSEAITAAEMARLRTLLVREGLAANALDATRLADAYSAVSWLQDHSIGANYNVIPERVLRAKAKAAGKPLHSEWASFADVAQFQNGLPANVRRQLELELFRRGLNETEGVDAARQRLAEWLAGNLRGLNVMEVQNRHNYPLLNRLIGTDRNKAWVARTAAIMGRTDSAFVCVGIGHLLGPSSIQEFLRQGGLTVRRV